MAVSESSCASTASRSLLVTMESCAELFGHAPGKNGTDDLRDARRQFRKGELDMAGDGEGRKERCSGRRRQRLGEREPKRDVVDVCTDRQVLQ